MKIKKLNVIDLFSGLGGASQAFVDRGHNVTRYDNDERFRNIPFTIIQDVKELTVLDLKLCDIILCGFPCNCFSILCNHLTWPKGIPRKETREAIAYVKWIRALIESAKPRYYIIENPMGMMRNTQALGKPDFTTTWAAYGAKQLKPTDFWGWLPPLERKLPFKWEKAPRGSNTGIAREGFKPEDRAKWPYDFSLAVCLAVEGKSPQTTLEQFRTFKEGNNQLPRRVE